MGEAAAGGDGAIMTGMLAQGGGVSSGEATPAQARAEAA